MWRKWLILICSLPRYTTPLTLFWVGGDFNLPDINWENAEITSHRNLKGINQKFLDTFSDTGLRQIVDEPTRGKNILDIFLTNCPDLVKSKNVISGLGDHEAVQIDCSMRLPRKNPTPHTHHPPLEISRHHTSQKRCTQLRKIFRSKFQDWRRPWHLMGQNTWKSHNSHERTRSLQNYKPQNPPAMDHHTHKTPPTPKAKVVPNCKAYQLCSELESVQRPEKTHPKIM